MRFWDSSAIVPLVVREVSSAACRHEQRVQPVFVVSRLAGAEIWHALARKRREGTLSAGDLRVSERALVTLASRWHVVECTEDVENEVFAVLERHPLRAADAWQLASARVFVDGMTRGRFFVTRDELLATAARADGFTVIVPRA